MAYKIGDRVRVIKDLEFKRGEKVKKGTLMYIVLEFGDGIYRCRPEGTIGIVYQLLSHQIEKIN